MRCSKDSFARLTAPVDARWDAKLDARQSILHDVREDRCRRTSQDHEWKQTRTLGREFAELGNSGVGSKREVRFHGKLCHGLSARFGARYRRSVALRYTSLLLLSLLVR